MPNLSEYAQWYYLIYLLPGGVALALLMLSALGGMGHHGHHGGMGHHGHHGDMRHGGVRHDGVKHGGGHRTAGQPAQGQPQAVSAHREPALSAFFGVGRVPAPLVWGSALLGWGVFGFWGTQLWQVLLHIPAAFVLPSLAAALAGAFVTEKATVEAVARWLPGDESYAVSAVELCGLIGTVAFPVGAARGRVHVYDTYGTLHDVSARAAPSQEPIGRGQAVLVVDYDAVRDQVIVEVAARE